MCSHPPAQKAPEPERDVPKCPRLSVRRRIWGGLSTGLGHTRKDVKGLGWVINVYRCFSLTLSVDWILFNASSCLCECECVCVGFPLSHGNQSFLSSCSRTGWQPSRGDNRLCLVYIPRSVHVLMKDFVFATELSFLFCRWVLGKSVEWIN